MSPRKQEPSPKLPRVPSEDKAGKRHQDLRLFPASARRDLEDRAAASAAPQAVTTLLVSLKATFPELQMLTDVSV